MSLSSFAFRIVLKKIALRSCIRKTIRTGNGWKSLQWKSSSVSPKFPYRCHVALDGFCSIGNYPRVSEKLNVPFWVLFQKHVFIQTTPIFVFYKKAIYKLFLRIVLLVVVEQSTSISSKPILTGRFHFIHKDYPINY